MENQFHERTFRKNTFQKAIDLLIFFLFISLLVYRLRFLNNLGFAWFLAFLCESWFTFSWILTMNAKWDLVEFKTHPERLSSRVDDELPPVDLFVTTADHVLEPPIITVNTVLSLLALDYPANKLACYVSDDGASPVTYYALVEALAFAKHWVPFCKQYNVLVRAPFRYFSAKESEACSAEASSSEFQQDWIYVRNKYEELCRKIQVATQKSSDLFDFTGEYTIFSQIDRRNHPSIVKVIWENKENLTDGVPHLIYLSREKRPEHQHHFKAGAMNVLTRVSGVMTNAPYMLNVDCDMFVNNPIVVMHAMCLFLEGEKKYAFVQYPQTFYGGLKDDPFGTELIVMYESVGRGVAGIQGILNGGTGCFHRREIIYGLCPDESGIKKDISILSNENSDEETLKMRFGSSMDFVTSVAQILSKNKENVIGLEEISRFVKAAIQVSDSTYESNTQWGTKIGWVYGSTTEDILTGLSIQARGWQTVFLTPDPPAFLGCAPTGGPACMTQQKRWATGLLEVLFGNNSPILATINRNLWFRQCLAYLYITCWGLRSIPELCYSLLPAYCILTNTSIMPKVSDRAILIPTSIFIIYNIQTILEYRRCGFSIRSWWNYNRMKRITTVSAWTFGVTSVILKLIGVSDTVFEVTPKETTSDENDNDEDPGRFTFDDSPMFVLGTVLVLAHITSLSLFLLGILKSQAPTKSLPGPIEIICSAWVLLSFLPFVKGLYRKGKYGIPTSTICKAMALVGFFVYFCTRLQIVDETLLDDL